MVSTAALMFTPSSTSARHNAKQTGSSQMALTVRVVVVGQFGSESRKLGRCGRLCRLGELMSSSTSETEGTGAVIERRACAVRTEVLYA